MTSAAPPAGAQTPPGPSPPPDLDQYVARAMEAFGAPGLSLTIVQNGKTLIAKGYGVRSIAGPLIYREVGGQTHLAFVTDSGGRVAYWISDDLIPVLIFQRVHGLGRQGELSWMGTICLAVLILTVVIWIGGGIIRRRCNVPLVISHREKQLRLASRVGVLLLLAVVLAWFVAFALLLNSVDGRVNGALTIAYLVGAFGLLGGLVVLVAGIRRALRGPGGRLVRAGEALLALCAIYGIWAILFFGLASFRYRY